MSVCLWCDYILHEIVVDAAVLSTVLACTGRVENGVKELVIYRQFNQSEWMEVSTVVSADSTTADLANCMLLQTGAEDCHIVASFRYHSNPYANGTFAKYSIQTKSSTDGQVTTFILCTVTTSNHRQLLNNLRMCYVFVIAEGVVNKFVDCV